MDTSHNFDTNHRLELVLDGDSLTVHDALQILEVDSVLVRLAPEVRPRMQATRAGALAALAGGQRVYGWNQALGHLKDKLLSTSEQQDFQLRILRSTAAGIGPMLPERVARLALIIKANQLARGTVGVRPELPERILDIVNAGVVPCMPQIGSLGVGDLQPQAAAGLVLVGQDAPALYKGRKGPASQILADAGVPTEFVLEAGEALPLISGGTVIAALQLDAARRAAALANLSEGALALFMEATRADANSLDMRTHNERHIPEQNEVAGRLRTLTKGSDWMTDEGRKRLGETESRIQDALSIRTAPHVFGALRHSIIESYTIFQREANSSTSNPLIFPRTDGPGYEFVMGGNWSSAVMGHAADSLNAILADVAVLSQELSARLLCEKWSYGLPTSLTGGKPGLNSGMTHVQTIATALIPEIQVRAAPSATLSRPAKFAQEDHNTMAMASVRNLNENIDRLEIVLAVLLLMSAQGIDLILKDMEGLHLGLGTKMLHDVIRQHIPALHEDRYMTPEIEKMVDMVRNDGLWAAMGNAQDLLLTPAIRVTAARRRSRRAGTARRNQKV